MTALSRLRFGFLQAADGRVVRQSERRLSRCLLRKQNAVLAGGVVDGVTWDWQLDGKDKRLVRGANHD